MYSTIPNSTTSPIASLDLDIKKKDEDKKKDSEEYIDRFNFWIYVGFIVLGILFLLTFALLIYSIFFNQEKEIKIENSISTVAKPIDNSSSSILKSIFKSKPIDNSISTSTIKPIDNSKNTSFIASILKKKDIETEPKQSFFSSLFNKNNSSSSLPKLEKSSVSFILNPILTRKIEKPK